MPIRHRNRLARKHFPVTAARFREARLSCFLTVEGCADLLRVSVRTVQNWESGTVRPPYAAYKLMRVLRGGKVLGPEWRGFTIRADRLNTPEGHTFHAGDLSWWSLLVRQARAYGNARRQLRALQDASSAAAAPDRAARPSRKADAGAAACSPAPIGDGTPARTAAPVDDHGRPLIASDGRGFVEKSHLPGTPATNRGYSETERAQGAVAPPRLKRRAATLPTAGVAAQLRAGVSA